MDNGTYWSSLGGFLWGVFVFVASLLVFVVLPQLIIKHYSEKREKRKNKWPPIGTLVEYLVDDGDGVVSKAGYFCGHVSDAGLPGICLEKELSTGTVYEYDDRAIRWKITGEKEWVDFRKGQQG